MKPTRIKLRPRSAKLCCRIYAYMEPPIWKTPQFWRDRAAEWRGPWTQRTAEGLCRQLEFALRDIRVYGRDAYHFLQVYKPEGSLLYWFPLSDRASRAALCDRIADDLEKQQTKG